MIKPSPLLRNNFRRGQMEPDGYLTIEFPNGDTKDYSFAQMKNWSIQQGCVFLSFEGETIIYPLISILGFTVKQNSREYVDTLPAEPDYVRCKHCTAKIR